MPPDAVAVANQRRLQRLIAAGGQSHTEDQWEAMVAFFHKRCVRCGSPDELQKDHVVSIKNGGDDLIENLQILCAKCNREKGSTSIDFRDDNQLKLFISHIAKPSAMQCQTDSKLIASIPKKEEEETSLREAKKKTKDFNQTRGSRWHAGQPFPTEWLTEANQIRSEHHLAPIDPEYEAAQFADYWAGKSGELGVKLDWHATWRNWVRKAKANGYAPPTNQNGHAKPLIGYGPSHLSTRIEDGYWRNRLIAFKERGYWASEWGFRPDDPPCYAPAHLLAEFGYPIPEPAHGGDER